MNSIRKVEVFRDGNWLNTNFEDISINDTFRLFEDDGTLVKDKKGNTVFSASTNAYINKDQIWEVGVKEEGEIK